MALVASNYWRRTAAGSVSRRQVVRGIALGSAGLAGAALIGCDGGDGGAGTAPTATAPAGVRAAGKPGGRLPYWLSADPTDYDLHATATPRTYAPVAPAYNQLVQFDPMVALDGPKSVIADLAKTWEVAPDGLNYTFKLVQNAKYHDGTPFTSADVVASLDRQRTPPQGLVAPRRLSLGAIEKMETPDAHTITLKMNRPAPPTSILPVLAQGAMAIYSKKNIDGGFSFGKGINGTGPFRFLEHRQADRMTFDRNKEYHVAARPYLDGIDFFVIPDRSVAATQIQGGRILHSLASSNLSTTAINDLKNVMRDEATYHEITGITGGTFHTNTTRAPWSDLRVRQALFLAINRQSIIDLTGDKGVPGGMMLHGGYWTLPDAEIAKITGWGPYSDANITRAKQLLSAAGVKEGHPVSFLQEDDPAGQQRALVIVQMLQKIGMDAKLDVVGIAEVVTRMQKQDFDFGDRSILPGFDDPDATWSEFFLMKSPNNYSRAGSQAIDDLFLKQSVELNAEKRHVMVQDLQKLTMSEVGSVRQFWGTIRCVLNKVVKDYVVHSSKMTNHRLEDVWLDR